LDEVRKLNNPETRDAKAQEQNMHKGDVRFEVIRAVTMEVWRLVDVY
jgi:hypothetical protein